jgi:hypothetical protein
VVADSFVSNRILIIILIDFMTAHSAKMRGKSRLIRQSDFVALADDVAVPAGLAIMPKGERATIVDVDPENGDLVIRLQPS